MIRPLVLPLTLLPFVMACNSADNVVPDPSRIGLGEALQDTVAALYAAQRASQNDPTRMESGALGINVCTVVATFNVTAGGTNNRELMVTAGTPAIAPVNASITGTAGQTYTASRGNQVTVTFTSPACNPEGTLGSTNPGRVLELERQIESVRSRGAGPVSGPRG